MKIVFNFCTAIFLVLALYSASCLFCMASYGEITEEEYQRLSQEIVEQSIRTNGPVVDD